MAYTFQQVQKALCALRQEAINNHGPDDVPLQEELANIRSFQQFMKNSYKDKKEYLKFFLEEEQERLRENFDLEDYIIRFCRRYIGLPGRIPHYQDVPMWEALPPAAADQALPGAAGLDQPDGADAGLDQPDGADAGLVQPDGADAGLVQPDGADAGLVQPDGADAGLDQPDGAAG